MKKPTIRFSKNYKVHAVLTVVLFLVSIYVLKKLFGLFSNYDNAPLTRIAAFLGLFVYGGVVGRLLWGAVPGEKE